MMNEQATTPPPADAPEHKTASRLARGREVLGVGLSLGVLCAALWFLHGELQHLAPDAIIEQIRATPWIELCLAIACTAGSYLTLTGYDAAALHYLGRKLAYRRVALISFMAYAVGNNVGFSALSGGSIRYRMYSLQGLSALEIAKVVVFTSTTFILGIALLLGLAMLVLPGSQTASLMLPPAAIDAVGAVLVAVPVVYLAGAFFHHRSLVFANWQIAPPTPATGLAQLALSVADLSLAAATLYVLLAPELPVGFGQFLCLYLIAMAAGLISAVPGGIGVFEAVLLATLPGMDKGLLLGNIIVYRLIYYLAPLAVALLLLIGHELKQHSKVILPATRRAGQQLSSVAPQLVSLAVFLAGTVLLLSGSTPAAADRLNIIARLIPLPVLELSHLVGSMLGVALLILAHGLYRRLRGAYLVAAGLLMAGILVSLLKGLDYEEALLLGGILLLVWVSRDEFYRIAPLASDRFTLSWIGSIVAVLCLAVWVGLMSFRHVSYSDQLWWQFALHADASRMLRASFVAGLTALGFVLWRQLRSMLARPLAATTADDMAQVRAVLATARNTTANVALLGDKRFHWSPDRTAFIMYQVSGNSWVALGDPVGPAAASEELAWSFRELVDRHDGRPVFYEISEASLPVCVNMGLAIAKLGEDARVSLKDFSLQGSQRAELRQALNRARREGASFDIVPRQQVAAITAELTAVSNDWLKDKATAEKGFSLGRYSEDYVCNFDCAVVRVQGAIVVFANLWKAPAAEELSIDLMRYNRHAPRGVMDYLFTELMLWGKDNGYAWFSLGMVPLSGMEERTLAPLWHKMGHLVYRHGESFYNFEGLRHYKEKFYPEWTARYVACPDGVLSLPRALLDSARLISGGVTRIVSK